MNFFPNRSRIIDLAKGREGTVWDWPTVVVHLLSHVWLFMTPGTAARQAPLFSTFSRSLLRFMSVESMMLSNHLILCCPLLLLPSFFPRTGVFSNELALHQVAKVLELQLQKQSFQWIFRLISFRSDQFDLPAVQGTLKSLLQHHSLKWSVLLHSSLWSNSHICAWLLEKPWYLHTAI